MRLLLDTHALLWYSTNNPQLSTKAVGVISDGLNEVFVSAATPWELAIKVSIGKYPLNAPFETFIRKAIHGNRFSLLPIELSHAAQLSTLPYHHRDPFDRMMIAQAIVEGLLVVSCDKLFDAYPIQRIW